MHSMFVLKLVLTPALIAAATVAGRKWGAAVGGWVLGLPLISGPVTLFLALERGTLFATRASQAAMLGLVALSAFCYVYSRLAFKTNWIACLVSGWIAFVALTLVLQTVSMSLWFTFAGVIATIAAVLRLIPKTSGTRVSDITTRWDLPSRMLIATAFVLLLTGVAEIIGPRLSGLFSAFPMFISILLVFTHRTQGPVAAARFLRGVMSGLFSFAGFFLVTGSMLQRFGILIAFGSATLATLTLHGALLHLLIDTN